MTAQEDTKLLLNELCRRWEWDWDDMYDLAISGQLPLWIELFDVDLVTRGKKGKTSKRFCPRAEVRPLPEELAQLKGRGEAMLVVLELPCLDDGGQVVTAINSVGEEWGDASMIGFKPANLFARLADVLAFEERHGIAAEPVAVEPDDPEQAPKLPRIPALPCQEIEHHAPELHIALQCWMILGEPAAAAGEKLRRKTVKKWIREQYPMTTAAAVERISRVIRPPRKE
jgi:hypothetical protein